LVMDGEVMKRWKHHCLPVVSVGMDGARTPY
jgi:hypothetical protein